VELEAAAPWKAAGDGTTAGLLKSMDAAAVDLAVICTIATKGNQTAGILEWCKRVRSERHILFPSVHPDTPGAAVQVQRIADEGFRGIKLHPMYQDFQADEPRLDPLYAAAAEAGLVVAIHCGCDIAFDDADPAGAWRMANLIDRHPALKLLCTHLGGWKAWDAAEQHLVGRRQKVWLETSFSLAMLGAERATALIRAHGIDRVLFGTDWPWKCHSEEVALVRGLDLSDEEKAMILGGNARRLFGI